jgi:hypothetical protein
MKFNPFKKEASIDVKRVFKVNHFSTILPPGWIDDKSKKNIIAFYKKSGDSGVIQISMMVGEKRDYSKLNPGDMLKSWLDKQGVKNIRIKTYERNNTKYALSDYYIKDRSFWRTMIVDNSNKNAFITYNIEEKFKNAYLKDVDEIFDSFIIEQ